MSRRSHRAVEPRIAVDHLAGEHAAAAYGAPTLARVVRALMLTREAQPHAPRLLALAQGVVALRTRIEIIKYARAYTCMRANDK